MVKCSQHKCLPPELEDELSALFSEADNTKLFKSNVTQDERNELIERWPVLGENGTLGAWWKAK